MIGNGDDYLDTARAAAGMASSSVEIVIKDEGFRLYTDHIGPLNLKNEGQLLAWLHTWIETAKGK